ncbi:cytochrome c oxidase subunit 4 [Terracoccus sp. 273MFTsu3.1]|uniref:cytochrome c oxidase subunit 4 n=1 Tax=Terracoccus sp. 273MFTsu3.1 TaxID=1172188 RepID=UPI00036A0A1F|nr:cytochrome c oxidase subunit 4 [Terracoccus sp. 273MFTsu3.1]
MRVETKLFLYLFVFFVPVVLMYGFWSKWEEPIGVTALILTALLFALTGFYLWMTGKKLPLRPEDNASGEIEDAEGNYGYFVASSWTPLWLAGSGAIMFAGLAIGWWLFIIGAVFAVVAVCLWVFESFSGEYSI